MHGLRCEQARCGVSQACCGVQLVPSRDALFAALGTPGEEMMQQLVATIDAFEPLLLKVQGFLVQHNLDFQTKV